MTLRFRQRPSAGLHSVALALAVLIAAPSAAQAATYPITPAQRNTAQQVAAAGVPLSDLADNAPDTYTVKRGDTLWAISHVFLKSPWRWPELWGMNLEQIHNPHLIYPGELLVLEKIGGLARLKVGNVVGGVETVKLSPGVRGESSESAAVASVPMNLIAPFLNQALVFSTDELARAPRIVATQEGHVLLGRGDLAYVRGETGNTRNWQVFRAPKPLVDPETHQILGYEARYVGTAEHTLNGESRPGAEQGRLEVPATFRITSTQEDAGVGDRLAPVAVRDFAPFVPHPPAGSMNGQIVSLYGDSLTAGSNQIVALNRGAADGLERGNVLALWHQGMVTKDESVDKGPMIKLPDERVGLLFVFRVFERVSYALIVESTAPALPGDRFSTP